MKIAETNTKFLGCVLQEASMEALMPREKLGSEGVGSLTDAELMAILLQTGSREQRVMELAGELTANGRLYNQLAGYTRLEQLTSIKGIGKAKAATVLAALELGRRLLTARPWEQIHLSCPQEGADFLMPKLRYATKEQFVVVMLNSKNRVIGAEVISEGSLTSSIVHAREVFQPAILQHAAAIMVAHNHPSGDPHPSSEDDRVTQHLLEAGKLLLIPVLDHLIIGNGVYYSYAEHQRLE